jgi:hypothetical protein
MISLLEFLRQGCNQFELQLEEKYVAKLKGGIFLSSFARIVGIGAPNGILIFCNSETVWPHRKLLVEENFAFSVLSDHFEDENFDPDSFKEMISDWGYVASAFKQSD